MIVNFTTNYQFNTRLDEKLEQIYTVEKTKLLGNILTNDLKLDEKLSELIKLDGVGPVDNRPSTD